MVPDFLSKINPGPGVAAFFVGMGQRTLAVGTGTSRRDQLLAAATLPFFMVAAMAAAVAVYEILLGMIPTGFPGLDAVMFLLGTLLVIGTLVLCVLWVRTGGFRLFAT